MDLTVPTTKQFRQDPEERQERTQLASDRPCVITRIAITRRGAVECVLREVVAIHLGEVIQDDAVVCGIICSEPFHVSGRRFLVSSQISTAQTIIVLWC